MICRLISCQAAIVLGLAMILGCSESGPPLGTVTGTVTMDGEKLPNAIVSFVPEAGGRASVATTDENGEYRLAYIDRPGALIGTHKISVTSTAKVESEIPTDIRSDDPRYAEMQSRQSDYNNATVKESIPAVYNSKSQLVREVSSGTNVIDLALTSDGKLP